MNGDQVFISYSREDEKWLQQLKMVVAPLVRENILRIWSDTEIPQGALWEPAIADAIERSSVALLLVTPAFLASDFTEGKKILSALDLPH